jgi:Domain of unknown function (DUF4388)
VAVEGTLDAFALGDVLRLLASACKTGWLSVDGDRGRATLQLVDGWLVDAQAEAMSPAASADEVVFDMLRFSRGRFRFSGDDPPAELPSAPVAVDQVLERATDLLAEWRLLEAVVPSPHHLVRLAPELAADEVTIGAQLWPILVAIAVDVSAAELGASLGLGELPTAGLIRDLVDLGVAQVDPPGTPAVTSGTRRIPLH